MTSGHGRTADANLALMTPVELPAIDRFMEQSGTSGYTLMERAGTAIATAAAALAPLGRIVVIAGPTNNGGDSMCAARRLRQSGRDVTLALFGERADLTGDRDRAAAAWGGPLPQASPEILVDADLIVDGLYGGGLSDDVTGEAAALVHAINASDCPVLAVDFPTGIAGGTGAILGTAVKADQTITFFCLKPGHLLMPGRLHCGTVSVDDIGIPLSVLDSVQVTAFRNLPALWLAELTGCGTAPKPASTSVLGGMAARGPAPGPASIGPGAVVIAVDSPSDADNLRSLSATCDGSRPPVILVISANAFASRLPAHTGSTLERSRQAADHWGMTIVVLGVDPVVAMPDGRTAIAGNGPVERESLDDSRPVADLIGALMNRGTPVFAACAAAAWMYGEALTQNASKRLPDCLSQVAQEVLGRPV